MHRAPLNEAAAAGMLMMAGWHRLSQQGLSRHSGSWPFTRWHDFDSQAPDLVVTNPPWGLRLGSQRSDDDQDAGEERGGHRGLSPDLEPGDEGQLESSWRSLATFLRAQCPDATALVLSGNKNAFNYLRMKTFRKRPLTVGGVEARVHAYHVLPPKSASHAAESSAEGAVAITM
ncbi:UPF0020 domain-containing protein [Haematococcus lacustris]|uniref:UPF0020 domain-containing protein n=1 Tax=Haematococcus lacustris TaxID=44745 RepID=A0A699ZD23_HAELA|nr:UPF0020 domain-containing protein [Haematococcus lacustris]